MAINTNCSISFMQYISLFNSISKILYGENTAQYDLSRDRIEPSSYIKYMIGRKIKGEYEIKRVYKFAPTADSRLFDDSIVPLVICVGVVDMKDDKYRENLFNYSGLEFSDAALFADDTLYIYLPIDERLVKSHSNDWLPTNLQKAFNLKQLFDSIAVSIAPTCTTYELISEMNSVLANLIIDAKIENEKMNDTIEELIEEAARPNCNWISIQNTNNAKRILYKYIME